MAVPDRQDLPYTHQSEQGVLNESRDEKYRVLGVELLVENDTEDALVRLKRSDLGGVGGGASGGATEVGQYDQVVVLEEIRSSIQSIAAAKGMLADLRVSIVGGTVAVTGSLTTVSTVTNLSQIGGVVAATLPQNINNQTAILGNINNSVRA